VGLISGSIRNQENAKVAQEMRKKCKTLIAVGSCANFGGIPALGNMFTIQQIFDRVYRNTKSTDAADTPAAEIPPLTDRVYAVSEVVKVDVGLPGCPTTPEMVAEALTALLQGQAFSIPERSVCDECPTKREKKAVGSIKRPLEPVEFAQGQAIDTVRCFMEQGYLCIGPVTRAGCGGSEKTPRCVKAHMTCRGCFGPVHAGANPMVDMMSALSTVGLKPQDIADRMATFNRFIGVVGRLRPMPAR
jgi:F420-non-reducing hydrogenase small subunit